MNLKKRIKLTNIGEELISIDKETFALQAYTGNRYVSLVKDASTEFVVEYLSDASLYDGIKAGLVGQDLGGVVDIQMFLFDAPLVPEQAEEPPESAPSVPPSLTIV